MKLANVGELKPYPRVKDSGVKWLGEVPSHWEVKPNRTLFDEVKERGRPEEPMLSVTIKRGVIRQNDLLEDTSKKDGSNRDKSAYKLVKPGDIAYNKMRAWQGAVGVSEYQGIVSPAYVVERPRSGVSSGFFHHLLRTPGFAKEAERWSYGITSDMWSLRPEHFKMIYACLPPSIEQAAIVRFLDHADRRIRSYIRVKQKLIALLEEQKQAIIHQAVRGQIDVRTGEAYRAYRPSAAEWLEEIPEHWVTKKLQQCVTTVGGMTPSMENHRFWNGLIPWITPKDMKREVISDSSIRIADAAVRETSLRLIVPPAVLIVVRGMILARRVPVAWTTVPVTVNQDMKAMRPSPDLKAEFLMYTLSSAGGALSAMIDEAGHGTRRLPTERWRALSIAVPPEDDQEAIVQYLATSRQIISQTIHSASKIVSALQELRTRLVADVVTGKLDVREASAELPEEDVPGDARKPAERPRIKEEAIV